MAFDHEFEEEELICVNCGYNHGDCECDEFEADPDSEDVCAVCGHSEDDPQHHEDEEEDEGND